MKCYVRCAVVAAAGFALSFGVLGGRAADDADLKSAVQKIAAALDKKEDASAKKLAAELAKNTKDFEDVMHLFHPCAKKGLGVGPKAGAITPDGIEKKLEALAEKGKMAPAQLDAEMAGLVDLGNNVAAIAEVSLAKKPANDQGKKKVADWVKWSGEMRLGGLALAAAAKKKDAAALEKAARTANESCTKCHDVFRYE